MTSRLHILPLLLVTLTPACVVELDDLPHIGSCHGGDTQTKHYTIDEPITAVIVDGGVGDVRVHGHAETGVVIDAAIHGGHDQPEPRLHVDGGVLHVEMECDFGCCGTDLTLAIPTTATLEVDVGVGDVTVTDLTGAVDVDLGTGDIALDGLAGGLGLHTGTGRIEGHGLRGTDAWADVGTGEVSLDYDPTAPLEALAVDSGVGRVDLWVPSGAYDLRLSTGVGRTSVSGLHDQPGASRRIDVDVGVGDIDIRGR